MKKYEKNKKWPRIRSCLNCNSIRFVMSKCDWLDWEYNIYWINIYIYMWNVGLKTKTKLEILLPTFSTHQPQCLSYDSWFINKNETLLCILCKIILRNSINIFVQFDVQSFFLPLASHIVFESHMNRIMHIDWICMPKW